MKYSVVRTSTMADGLSQTHFTTQASHSSSKTFRASRPLQALWISIAASRRTPNRHCVCAANINETKQRQPIQQTQLQQQKGRCSLIDKKPSVSNARHRPTSRSVWNRNCWACILHSDWILIAAFSLVVISFLAVLLRSSSSVAFNRRQAHWMRIAARCSRCCCCCSSRRHTSAA